MTDLNKLHAAAQNPFTHKAIKPNQKAMCIGDMPSPKADGKAKTKKEDKA